MKVNHDFLFIDMVLIDHNIQTKEKPHFLLKDKKKDQYEIQCCCCHIVFY